MALLATSAEAFAEVKETIYRAAIREQVATRYGLGHDVADRIYEAFDIRAVWEQAPHRDYFAANATRELERLLTTHPAIYWWPWSEVPAWQ